MPLSITVGVNVAKQIKVLQVASGQYNVYLIFYIILIFVHALLNLLVWLIYVLCQRC